MKAKQPASEAKKRERFQRRGKHLVVSTRISFDPKQDAGIIALLREAEPNGMAHLIRTALRVCYQACSRRRTDRSRSIPASTC